MVEGPSKRNFGGAQIIPRVEDRSIASDREGRFSVIAWEMRGSVTCRPAVIWSGAMFPRPQRASEPELTAPRHARTRCRAVRTELCRIQTEAGAPCWREAHRSCAAHPCAASRLRDPDLAESPLRFGLRPPNTKFFLNSPQELRPLTVDLNYSSPPLGSCNAALIYRHRIPKTVPGVGCQL